MLRGDQHRKDMCNHNKDVHAENKHSAQCKNQCPDAGKMVLAQCKNRDSGNVNSRHGGPMSGEKVVERKEKSAGACNKGTLEKDNGPPHKRLAGQNTKHHPCAGANSDGAEEDVNNFENCEDHGLFLSASLTGNRGAAYLPLPQDRWLF